MALFAANVSWQGINPPGAGGDPLVYPATTLAALVACTPHPTPPPRSAVGLPGARVSPSCRILSVKIETPQKVGTVALVLILSSLGS